MPSPLHQAQTLYNDGNRRMADGDAAGAEACFLQALALVPDLGAARANLGYLKEQQGALAEAEVHYCAALALLPEQLQLHLNLASLLLKLKRFDDAETAGRAALQLAPAAPAAWSNLGVLLACVQREEEAERCYRKALELDAGYAKAHYNLGYLLLRQGRWTEGLPKLDMRWRFERLLQHFTCPRWQGEDLDGKSIVIGFEAGHGDTLQFCRYAALLKARGAARVAVYCHPALKQLLTTLAGADEVYAIDDASSAGGWDCWTLPMSLPQYFDTRVDNVQAPIPYLSADAALAAQWAAALPEAPLRVGLAWRGNPNFENDADRSLPSLQMLAPLGAADGVQFVSLQKGLGESEALQAPAGMRLHAAGAALRDFADTAALISNLDLVISIDTAVAHLAGALGKPCWLLLPDYRTDWRWLTARADTPWYPQMRLFRQPRAGDWASVVTAVAAALQSWRGP